MKKKIGWGAALCLVLVAALWISSSLAFNAKTAKWPATPGNDLKTNGSLKVDAGNTQNGYFQACVSKKSSHKMKLRVVKGDTTLTYDLNSKGNYEVFPLQFGTGKYEISLYENVSGNKYSNAGKVTLNVSKMTDNACFLYPNQYVNYTKDSGPVKKALELCEEMTDQKEVFDKVCKFMKTSFVYDYIKAMNIKAGVLPEIEDCFNSKKGVCQDLSAIMCSMLRTQGIPTKLIIGYADKNYHAWVVSIIDGKEYFFDPTAAINGIAKVKKYSVERYY